MKGKYIPLQVGVFLFYLAGGRYLLSAQEKMPFSSRNAFGAPSEQDLGHFSARNAFEVASAQDLGYFSAWEAGGVGDLH